MSNPLRHGYALWVGIIAIGLLLVSGVTVYLMLESKQGTARAELFGSPVTVEETDEAPVRHAEAGAAREGRLDLPVTEREEYASPPAEAAPVAARDSLWDLAGMYVGDSHWERALEVYELLHRREPDDVAIAFERGQILAWSGRPVEAAELLAAALARGTAADAAERADLQLERARYLWWGGRVVEADQALDEVLALRPGDRDAVTMQASVRQAITPDARTAARWAVDGGDDARLVLARALVREDRHAAALPHFRAALRLEPVAGPLHLEYADAAAAADSLHRTVAALEAYLDAHPEAREERIRLARTLTWADRPNEAISQYDRLLARGDDAGLRFDRARLLAWNGRTMEAEAELLAVVGRLDRPAEAYLLLGDIARWRHQTGLALERYAAAEAADPTIDGIEERVRDARTIRLAALARGGEDLSTDQWQVDSGLFTNTSGLRRLSSDVSRGWSSAGRTLLLRARQVTAGGRAPLSPIAESYGYGVEVETRLPLAGDWLTGGIQAGVHDYHGTGPSLSGGGELAARTAGGTGVTVAYERQPSFLDASTLASLDTEVVADRLRLSLSRDLGGWYLWSRGEYTRLGSDIGDTDRGTISLSLSRPLTETLTASVGAWTLATDGKSPVLADRGSLYWSPRLYLAPHIGLSQRMELGDGWALQGRIQPGWAFVREDEDGYRRFSTGSTATLQGGADLLYVGRRWDISISAEASGAAASSYGTAGLRARIIHRPSRP